MSCLVARFERMSRKAPPSTPPSQVSDSLLNPETFRNRSTTSCFVERIDKARYRPAQKNRRHSPDGTAAIKPVTFFGNARLDPPPPRLRNSQRLPCTRCTCCDSLAGRSRSDWSTRKTIAFLDTPVPAGIRKRRTDRRERESNRGLIRTAIRFHCLFARRGHPGCPTSRRSTTKSRR